LTASDTNQNIVLSIGSLSQLHNKKTENTHTHTQPFYGSVEFVRENPGEPVPEETFTHYSHKNRLCTV